jgi:hypothetical protein
VIGVLIAAALLAAPSAFAANKPWPAGETVAHWRAAAAADSRGRFAYGYVEGFIVGSAPRVDDCQQTLSVEEFVAYLESLLSVYENGPVCQVTGSGDRVG